MPHCLKQMASFFLTTKCNLNCIYCYNIEERQSLNEHTLPLHVATAGIDFFFSTNASRHIRFYGPGEPTQEFDLMRDIVMYAQSMSSDTTVEIQTNGIFGASIRDWILENVNIVWLSFDGPPDIQNHNRPLLGQYPSAPILEANTRSLNTAKGSRNLMVGARVTMTDLNIERQIEMVDYFLDLGIKHVWTNPLFFTVDRVPVIEDTEKQNTYSFSMDRYIDCYVEAYHYAKDKGLFWGSFLGVNFDGESRYHCRACTPVPHFTPDGFVSACDMVVLGSNAYHMDPLIYGKWDEERNQFIFDQDKIERLQDRSSTAKEYAHCSQCEVQYHCGGYCLGEVLNESGKLNGVPKNCSAVKRLFNKIGIVEPYEYLHP